MLKLVDIGLDLSGTSGAGKSTLINYLMSEARQITSEVRETDGKGRHVTSFRAVRSSELSRTGA